MAPLSRENVDSLEEMILSTQPEESHATSSSCSSSMTDETAASSTRASPSSPQPPSSRGGRRRQTRPAQNVSFAGDEKLATIHKIPHAKDYLSDDEFQAVYLSKQDLCRIQRDNRETMTNLKFGSLPDSDSQCFRGLECHLPQARRERFVRVTKVLQAVLDEQDASGRIQPHWIHTVYCELTVQSEETSILLALLDENAVAHPEQ
jgi:hypothetical protein